MKIFKRVLLSVIIIAGSISMYAQGTDYENKYRRLGYNTITHAVPFITLSPDARSGSMADVGAATEADANSMHWNPAKYAFIDKNAGVSLNYTPWMRSLGISDINLFNVAGYYKLDDKSAIAATLTYFSLGEITYRDNSGNNLGQARPNEFAIDATYSRKFSEKISGAVAGRFIYSNLTAGLTDNYANKAGTSVAADIALYYVEPLTISQMDAEFILGVNISNIGSKMSYDITKQRKEFIPTNLRIGPALKLNIDDYNSFLIAVEASKLLVPTPPLTDDEGNIIYGRDSNVSLIKGMIQSFYDAPGYTEYEGEYQRIGVFREELQEITLSIGAEYWYNRLFAVRLGYFYENPRKGDRQYITIGAGIRYNVFGLDLSYLIALKRNSPLENTLRVSLTLDFDAFSGQ
ncbi:type IX secretion system outer membrane channel protein PorV [Bacteroidales bacterium OttesenSCG-928-K03]|nr:type IX secretion system outer membrane channel protein PorV [Bacteroidales bacterium OttesenSCG-928-K03]